MACRRFPPVGAGHARDSTPGFHDPDFLVRQAVELVHQLVDLAVGGFDPAIQRFFHLRDFGTLNLFVQIKQLIDKSDKRFLLFGRNARQDKLLNMLFFDFR